MFNRTNNSLASGVIEALLEVVATEDYDGQLAKFLGVNKLTAEEIATLQALSANDRKRLIRSGHSIVNITLNRKNVASLLSMINEGTARGDLVSELVKAGAPQSMMFDHFGTSTDEMAKLRRELGMKTQGGRPAGMTEAEEQIVYALYKAEKRRFQGAAESYPEVRMCLRIHYETSVSLTKIYNFIKSLHYAQ